MNAIANVSTSSVLEAHTDSEADSVVTIALFWGVGLLAASFCMAIYGPPDLSLGLSLGFF